MKTTVGKQIIFCCVFLFIGLWCGVKYEQKILMKMLDETTQEVEEEIKFLETLKSIILAESDGIHEGVWGDDGKSYGIAQFQFSTFEYLKKLAGMENLEWKKPLDQIVLLTWCIRNNVAQKYWTTYPKKEKK